MPQGALDNADVHLFIGEIRREAMAQPVRMYSLSNVCLAADSLEQTSDVGRLHRFPTQGGEQRAADGAGGDWVGGLCNPDSSHPGHRHAGFSLVLSCPIDARKSKKRLTRPTENKHTTRLFNQDFFDFLASTLFVELRN